MYKIGLAHNVHFKSDKNGKPYLDVDEVWHTGYQRQNVNLDHSTPGEPFRIFLTAVSFVFDPIVLKKCCSNCQYFIEDKSVNYAECEADSEESLFDDVVLFTPEEIEGFEGTEAELKEKKIEEIFADNGEHCPVFSQTPPEELEDTAFIQYGVIYSDRYPIAYFRLYEDETQSISIPAKGGRISLSDMAIEFQNVILGGKPPLKAIIR